MQKLYMILAAVVLLAVALFAGMNADEITVRYIFLGEIKAPAFMLILTCFFAGGLLMALFDLGRQFRTWTEIRGLKKQLKTVEEERDLLQSRVKELSGSASVPEKTDGPAD